MENLLRSPDGASQVAMVKVPKSYDMPEYQLLVKISV